MRLAPIYRLAVNPFEIKRLVKVVCRSHLPRIAEEHGLHHAWLLEANDQIGAHFPKARIFGEMLRDELLSETVENDSSVAHNAEEEAQRRYLHDTIAKAGSP